MSAHTPGPWTIKGPSRLDPGRSDGGDFAILDPDGMIIAEAFNRVGKEDYRPAQTNARLIAAAPDLLEALTMVRDADNDCHKDGLPTIPRPARAKIDAAIAKATGENA